jgi:hypothetical protein
MLVRVLPLVLPAPPCLAPPRPAPPRPAPPHPTPPHPTPPHLTCPCALPQGRLYGAHVLHEVAGQEGSARAAVGFGVVEALVHAVRSSESTIPAPALT